MRNLLRYPVNDTDRLEVLKRLLARCEEESRGPDARIGDMTGVVLQDLIARITPTYDLGDFVAVNLGMGESGFGKIVAVTSSNKGRSYRVHLRGVETSTPHDASDLRASSEEEADAYEKARKA